MSTKLSGFKPTNLDELELGDRVSFKYIPESECSDEGMEPIRLYGKVVRIYASRELFHVEVDGERYRVDVDDDIRMES